ncbi:Fic family protein, partial [Pluralibacter gergoviae]
EVLRLLRVIRGEMKRSDIQAALGLKHEDHFRNTYLLPALASKLIEMTIPDKPRSSRQMYRLTSQGDRLLKQQDAE